MGKTKIIKEELEDLIKRGLKDSEISKILNVKTISIYFARKRYNIKRNSFSKAKSIKLTLRQKEFIVGSLLGDGNLRIDKNCISPRYTCEHSIKQKDYCLYKFDILKGLNPFYKELTRKSEDKRTGIKYSSCKIRLNNNPELLWFYDEFYKPDKIISNNILKYYSPFAMAIHYMDDGYLSANSYYLATNCFDIQSINILRDYLLDTYSIKTSVHKGNILYILSESKETFTNLIKPYIIKSMKYKLHNI